LAFVSGSQIPFPGDFDDDRQRLVRMRPETGSHAFSVLQNS
jgi:hypothetical protein